MATLADSSWRPMRRQSFFSRRPLGAWSSVEARFRRVERRAWGLNKGSPLEASELRMRAWVEFMGMIDRGTTESLGHRARQLGGRSE
uniref:Uncharacterized protein n=1 Tax=Arundo donax TaxID=35708 RepID=A0A0A9FKY2_ARUDO